MHTEYEVRILNIDVEDVIKRSDFVIVNDGIQDIEEQIDIIIKQIRQQV